LRKYIFLDDFDSLIFKMMVNQKITVFLFGLIALVAPPAIAETCQKTVVVSQDGYANVRYSPRTRKDNVIGTLPLGVSLEPVSRRSGWVNIRQPFLGWIRSSQLSKLSCDAAANLLLEKGLPAISRLGKQAILGNSSSAEAFLKMARGLDGVVAETYIATLTDWASQNPSFLVSVLQRQTSTIRYSVLDDLNRGLGTKQSPERLQFEQFLKTLPANHLIIQDWKKQSKT
jgi:hypothetical protein